MIALQSGPPTLGPPSPPGLPVDSGIIVLLIIAVIYGILLVRVKSSKYHLKNNPSCIQKNKSFT